MYTDNITEDDLGDTNAGEDQLRPSHPKRPNDNPSYAFPENPNPEEVDTALEENIRFETTSENGIKAMEA